MTIQFPNPNYDKAGISGAQIAQKMYAQNLLNKMNALKLANLPASIKEDLLKGHLANLTSQEKLRELPIALADQEDRNRALQTLQRAQAYSTIYKLYHPEATTPTGTIAQLLYANQLIKSGDPQKIKIGQMVMNGIKASTDYKKRFAEIAGLSPTGREFFTEDYIKSHPQGFVSPFGRSTLFNQNIAQTGTQPQQLSLTPQQQQRITQIHGALQKKVSDVGTRKRANAATVMLGEINKWNALMPNITKFAGASGAAKRAAGAAGTLVGNESQDYNNYLIFKRQGTKILSDQMRQMLGTSVRNSYVSNYILPMVDNFHNTLLTNQQLAMQQWDFLRNWIKIYQKAYNWAANYGVLPNTDILMDRRVRKKFPELYKAIPLQKKSNRIASKSINKYLNLSRNQLSALVKKHGIR